MTTDHGCSCERPDCLYDKAFPALPEPSKTTSIVPAFFVIDAHAEDADTYAAEQTIAFNGYLKTMASTTQPTFQARLRLCESSPTVELELDTLEQIPRTLEGMTCDSGSDRSATALIQRIVETKGETTIDTLCAILQMAEGWLQQRMALHPQASTEPAPGREYGLNASTLLLHAAAKSHVQWGQGCDASLIGQAIEQAKAENPGHFEGLVNVYANKPDMTGATP